MINLSNTPFLLSKKVGGGELRIDLTSYGLRNWLNLPNIELTNILARSPREVKHG